MPTSLIVSKILLKNVSKQPIIERSSPKLPQLYKGKLKKNNTEIDVVIKKIPKKKFKINEIKCMHDIKVNVKI